MNSIVLALGLCLLCLVHSTAAYTDAALADQITNLPGAENLEINFNQFSGYLTVNGTKNMHYWFVESMNDPANDPIAFWTNGGPGCSGLLGFMTEQGPFRANKDLSLKLNPYSWNTIANMVFIEQPCGVGFSYSDNDDDLENNDAQAAKDNYWLIQSFMDRFPEMRKNPLFITSESYGGHYMPTLAVEITQRNAAGNDPQLNFKGLAVGNPATTFYSMIPAGIDCYWGHQIVSKPLWDEFTHECRDKRLPNMTICESIFSAMYIQVGRNFNPYALDYPVCVSDSPARYGRSQRNALVRNILYKSSDEVKESIGLVSESDYEPCADDYMSSYLNLDNVKRAIHVKEDITWVDCSHKLRYKQSDGHDSMVPYYEQLLQNTDINILVYSGDDDSVCATVGTQSWIWDLGSKMGYTVSPKSNWTPYKVNGQQAGFLTKWSNSKLAFATVHFAGHEVPSYQPEVALNLFKSFLNGELTNGV